MGELAAGGEIGTFTAGIGAENRGTDGLAAASGAGFTLGCGGGGGATDLAGANGCAGAGGVGAIGMLGIELAVEREETTATGLDGVGRRGEGEAGDATGAAGLPATGGLTDGKPIMVRLRGAFAAPGGAVEARGCGVMPERTAGITAEGRVPGIKEGRGDGWAGGIPAGAGAGIGRIPVGRVGGLTVHPVCTGTGAGPRSIVISP